MNSYFQHTKVKRALSINKKSIIILFIVLAVLLVSSAIIEYKSSKNELIEVLQEQSLALVASLEQGSVNAIQSFQVAEEILAERLLGLARLIEEIDYNDKLSLQLITKIAAENHIFRINVFDKNGNKLISNAGGMGTGRNSRQNASEYLLEKIKNNDELLIGFGQRRFGTAQRFAVAKKRRNGGVLVLNIDATEILDYRKTIGAGKLYKDIGESNGIEYTVLQDSTGILLASQNVDSLSSIYSDEFLQKSLISGEALTRILLFKGVYVFEIVKPLYVNDNFQGLMRIGLSAQHLKDVEAGAKARIILASIILLIIGSVVIGFVISNQNYHELQKAYSRIETYTGSILTNMNDAVIAVDHNENISIFNKAAEKLFQVNAKDILYKKCDHSFKNILPFITHRVKK